MSKRPVTQSNAVFATADIGKIQRSTFIRPSSLKTSFNCGKLVPIYIDEVLPGDTFKIDMKFLSRLTTPVFPTMDDITLEFYAFFVPNRLVWNGWEELCGENKTGAWVPETPPALVPVYDNSDLGSGVVTLSKKLGDYYGLPVGLSVNDCNVSALPFRGYALIWNEWFRDENLQAPVSITLGNTEDASSASKYGPNADLFSVNKFHDYFTSALPSPQRGSSPLIPIELNQLIPVVTDALPHTSTMVNNLLVPMRYNTDSDVIGDISLTGKVVLPSVNEHSTIIGKAGTVNPSAINGSSVDGWSGSLVPDNLYADARGVGNLNETTISQLRTLFQIQKLYERDARGGTRYREMLLSHFGVDAGDYRLQRPEFLGKFVSRVGIQSVPQTSSTDATSPQGNLAAYSLTTGSSVITNKSFVEHGFVHVFAVARQVKTYQQGVEKFWSRRERFDFYYPTLAHISEQPIYNREIFALEDTETVNGVSTQVYHGDEVFGYQEAWADYRYKPNKVTGQMRSGVTNSYDVWHYADYYSETPKLSSGWITDNSETNVDRTLAVSSSADDQIKMDVAFVCKATRPMPIKSIPGLVDHF